MLNCGVQKSGMWVCSIQYPRLLLAPLLDHLLLGRLSCHFSSEFPMLSAWSTLSLCRQQERVGVDAKASAPPPTSCFPRPASLRPALSASSLTLPTTSHWCYSLTRVSSLWETGSNFLWLCVSLPEATLPVFSHSGIHTFSPDQKQSFPGRVRLLTQRWPLSSVTLGFVPIPDTSTLWNLRK